MASMKSTPMQSEIPKYVDPKDGSDSKGGDTEFLKSLDSDELEMIKCIAKPPLVRNLQYFVSVGLFDKGENPHRFREHKHILTLEIEKVFGK